MPIPGVTRQHAAVKHFAPIVLPDAYRRTSLVRQMRQRANVFAVLLARLDPRRYQAVCGGDVKAVYLALLGVLSKRFPIWWPDYMLEDYPDDEDVLGSMEMLGIPICPLGIDDENGTYNGSPTLGLLSYLLTDPVHRLPVADLGQFGGCDAWRKHTTLKPWFDQMIEEKWCEPPHGRQWAGRWQSLSMLVKYVMHDTGYQWLDVSEFDMDEGGNPPWSMDDIEWLTNDWNDSQPVWKSLKDLMNWLDSKPAVRLPRLCAILTGNDQARQKYSEPKPLGKTLAEVFCEIETVHA
jgi:hypothetical protein